MEVPELEENKCGQAERSTRDAEGQGSGETLTL